MPFFSPVSQSHVHLHFSFDSPPWISPVSIGVNSSSPRIFFVPSPMPSTAWRRFKNETGVTLPVRSHRVNTQIRQCQRSSQSSFPFHTLTVVWNTEFVYQRLKQASVVPAASFAFIYSALLSKEIYVQSLLRWESSFPDRYFWFSMPSQPWRLYQDNLFVGNDVTIHCSHKKDSIVLFQA